MRVRQILLVSRANWPLQNASVILHFESLLPLLPSFMRLETKMKSYALLWGFFMVRFGSRICFCWAGVMVWLSDSPVSFLQWRFSCFVLIFFLAWEAVFGFNWFCIMVPCRFGDCVWRVVLFRLMGVNRIIVFYSHFFVSLPSSFFPGQLASSVFLVTSLTLNFCLSLFINLSISRIHLFSPCTTWDFWAQLMEFFDGYIVSYTYG